MSASISNYIVKMIKRTTRSKFTMIEQKIHVRKKRATLRKISEKAFVLTALRLIKITLIYLLRKYVSQNGARPRQKARLT